MESFGLEKLNKDVDDKQEKLNETVFCNCKQLCIVISKTTNKNLKSYYKCPNGNTGCGFERNFETTKAKIQNDVPIDSKKKDTIADMPEFDSPEDKALWEEFLREEDRKKKRQGETTVTKIIPGQQPLIVTNVSNKKFILPQSSNDSILGKRPIPSNSTDNINPPKCFCGDQSGVFTCKNNGKYHGQKYYACSRQNSDPNRCKYWKLQSEYLEQSTKAEKFPPVKRSVATHSKIYHGPGRFPLIEFNGNVTQHPSAHPLGYPKKKDEISRKQFCIEMFAEIAESKGWKCRLAHGWEDEYNYVHLLITKGEYEKALQWIRIEEAKSVQLYNGPIQYDKIWLQVHGINTRIISTNEDDNGWIINGKYDNLAVEGKDCFILMNRKQLWKYIDTQIEKVFVDRPEDAENKYYKHAPDSPHGSHNEILTLVSMEKLTLYNQSIPDDEEKLIIGQWKFPQELKKAFEEKIVKLNRMQNALGKNIAPPVFINSNNSNNVKNVTTQNSGKEEEENEEKNNGENTTKKQIIEIDI